MGNKWHDINRAQIVKYCESNGVDLSRSTLYRLLARGLVEEPYHRLELDNYVKIFAAYCTRKKEKKIRVENEKERRRIDRKKKKAKSFKIVECEFCNEKFEVNIKLSRKFCSTTCAGKKRTQNCKNKKKWKLTKKEQIKFRQNQFNITICKNCGLFFKAKNNTTKNFCSSKCSNEASVFKSCGRCGNELMLHGLSYQGKLCKKCFYDVRFEKYLKRLKLKFIRKYGTENMEAAFQIKIVEAALSIGLKKIGGQEKWLENQKNLKKLTETDLQSILSVM